MGRKNIFKLANKKRNFKDEIERIDKLLEKYGSVLYIYNEEGYDVELQTSIINYIDDFIFIDWKNRGTCISCLDFRKKIGLGNISHEQKVSLKYILNYCEYAANLIYLIKWKKRDCDTLEPTVDKVIQNIKIILSWYGFELNPIIEEEKVLVVQKSAQATAVAEIIDEKLAYSVIDYNHFLLKGDIEKKKAIILSLGSDLESKREDIKNIDKELCSNIFYMLNNLNLRHNNCSPEDAGKYKEFVANLKNSELEKWYDELYQLMLLAYLLLDNVERSKNIKDLKDKIEAKQENNNG